MEQEVIDFKTIRRKTVRILKQYKILILILSVLGTSAGIYYRANQQPFFVTSLSLKSNNLSYKQSQSLREPYYIINFPCLKDNFNLLKRAISTGNYQKIEYPVSSFHKKNFQYIKSWSIGLIDEDKEYMTRIKLNAYPGINVDSLQKVVVHHLRKSSPFIQNRMNYYKSYLTNKKEVTGSLIKKFKTNKTSKDKKNNKFYYSESKIYEDYANSKATLEHLKPFFVMSNFHEFKDSNALKSYLTFISIGLVLSLIASGSIIFLYEFFRD